MPRQQADDNRGWVQDLVERLTGRRLPVTVVVADAVAVASPMPAASPAMGSGAGTAEAAAAPGASGVSPLEHDTVKSILEMFPVEKTRIDAGQ